MPSSPIGVGAIVVLVAALLTPATDEPTLQTEPELMGAPPPQGAGVRSAIVAPQV